MTPPAAVTKALQRQKRLATAQLDAYYKQLLKLFEEDAGQLDGSRGKPKGGTADSRGDAFGSEDGLSKVKQ